MISFILSIIKAFIATWIKSKLTIMFSYFIVILGLLASIFFWSF